MRFSLLILFLLFAMFSEADTLNISKFIVLDNDTLFTSEIPQLDIIGFKDFKDNKKYRKLKRRVLKVYPFALETQFLFSSPFHFHFQFLSCPTSPFHLSI